MQSLWLGYYALLILGNIRSNVGDWLLQAWLFVGNLGPNEVPSVGKNKKKSKPKGSRLSKFESKPNHNYVNHQCWNTKIPKSTKGDLNFSLNLMNLSHACHILVR